MTLAAHSRIRWSGDRLADRDGSCRSLALCRMQQKGAPAGCVRRASLPAPLRAVGQCKAQLTVGSRDRNTARATLGQGRRFRGTCPFSLVHGSRFRMPPCHPGQSHLASAVGDHDCPSAVFPVSRRLKRSLAYPHAAQVYCTVRCRVPRPRSPVLSPVWRHTFHPS
jgi:hypothetical protein